MEERKVWGTGKERRDHRGPGVAAALGEPFLGRTRSLETPLMALICPSTRSPPGARTCV